MRFLILCGTGCLLLFLHWLLNPEHIGNVILFWLLVFALLFKVFKCIQEWYHYWSVSIPEKPEWKTRWSVDMLTTACPGEPKEMIIRTLHAMKAVKYPHTNYLCDEGNDPELKKACNELGIIHVTRAEKIDAKAGNINNALRRATGEICVILDPDHVPIPEFLHRVLPYFEDPQVGYVQCVQGYSNQNESFIAKAAAEQSYHFYGPMMMSMNTYGTTQAIGANCTFRRRALDSIGGHAAGLAEDMHTAMQLQAKGWKPLYIPEILTRGLVPSTLSAYYKQQLKWSRGCFELLFRVYPVLFKKFTWRQKLHHFTMPLFFLFGLVNFIDLLVPLVALGLAEVPWEFNLKEFATFFLPFCGTSIVIRLFAQRWLMEKNERGLHLSGGILRIATWWIFLLGFVYSILNIKVPYIPTPKEDEKQNHWLLSIPNTIIILCCVSITLYGLSIDWTPYSLAMAGYALINISLLAIVIFMSQQKLLHFLHTYASPAIRKYKLWVFLPPKNVAENLNYRTLVSRPIAMVFGVAFLFLSYSNIGGNLQETEIVFQKDPGGFYLGLSADESSIPKVLFQRDEDVHPETLHWVKDSSLHILLSRYRGNTIPVIKWNTGKNNDSVYSGIAAGTCDDYLKTCSDALRAHGKPVFLSFSPEIDKPDIKTSFAFIKAWQYIYGFFSNNGINNVTWLWIPRSPEAITYYPGNLYVDWIGLSCLNPIREPSDNNYSSFEKLYSPYRKIMIGLRKPFMILEFGSASGTGQGIWFAEALENIEAFFPEIKSLVFFLEKKNHLDFSLKDSLSLMALRENLENPPFSDGPFMKYERRHSDLPGKTSRSSCITGTPGSYNLLSDGKPFYIRGVAYNTAHDWRDGNIPLTRRQLERDFERIKAMGANTIRRYDNGIYDNNILSIAEEYGLKVLFGFWFDPAVDYYKDTSKVREYIELVEKKVTAYKKFKSVLAWSLGNETSGLLKHHFSQPYLTKVRMHYLELIELLAQRIHEIDPERTVISCLEHSGDQLKGEVASFHDHVPSVDILGINSYYKEQVNQVKTIAYQFDSIRPYLLSEFGPNGYWNANYNFITKDGLREQNDEEKSAWYKQQWKDNVTAYEGFNVGGIAFCWQDRMEGSYTWFGLSDFEGRLKPGYFSLKETWTGLKSDHHLPVFAIHAGQDIVPGKEIYFAAIPSGPVNEKVSYEWLLMKNEYLEKMNVLEQTGTDNEILVHIPEESASYRLYLFVSDSKGNVTTSSIPLFIKTSSHDQSGNTLSLQGSH